MFDEYVNDEEHALVFAHGQFKYNQKQEPIEELANLTTDELLDIYNDYDKLHKAFGDDAYKVKMDQIIKVLNKN